MDFDSDRSIGPKRHQNVKFTSRFKTKIKIKDNKNGIYHEIKDSNWTF